MNMEKTERKPIAARIEYLGRTPRKFELPIPFISKCEKTGEVECDPVGTFPIEDADRLLAIDGAKDLFRLVEYVYDDSSVKTSSDKPTVKEEIKSDVKVPVAAEKKEISTEEVGPLCACGCGEHIVLKPQHKKLGVPKYIRGHYGKKPAVPA